MYNKKFQKYILKVAIYHISKLVNDSLSMRYVYFCLRTNKVINEIYWFRLLEVNSLSVVDEFPANIL